MYSRGIDGAPTVLPGVKPADQIGQYVNTTMNAIYSFVDGYLSKTLFIAEKLSSVSLCTIFLTLRHFQ